MEETESRLIDRIKAGDRDAYRQLVVSHAPQLFKLAFRLTGNEADAEEVVQDAFVRAFLHIQGFVGNSSLSTWLHRVVTNVATDLHRMRKRRPDWYNPEELQPNNQHTPVQHANPEGQLFGRQLGQLIAQQMNQLSDTERRAFVLRHYQGVPLKEIAESLDLSEGATKQAIFRAVHKLRQGLNHLMEAST